MASWEGRARGDSTSRGGGVAGDAVSGTNGGTWIAAGELDEGRQKGSLKVNPRSSPTHRAATQT